ncbi:MAG: hypothetical protein HC802_17405, partial [Caldilineaceae bacterium]|nr:hypothetical protein [Caldilineaceae bacterium]
MQDLLSQPFKREQISKGSEYHTEFRAHADWQIRICKLDACLAATHLTGKPARFNLLLTDPIEQFLPADATWRGIGGEYVVSLGIESAARKGAEPGLPTLHASVGAFSRLWLGVGSATTLAMTDELDGPDE